MNRKSRSDTGTSPLRRLDGWLNGPAQPQTGSTLLRVVRDPAGSWVITEPGRDVPLQRLASRRHAVALATATLREGRGGAIEVREEAGAITRVPVAKGKPPWWQATRTPRSALLLGLLWLGLLVIRVVDDGWPVHGALDLVMLVVTGALAALYLATAVLLRRRRRSHQA